MQDRGLGEQELLSGTNVARDVVGLFDLDGRVIFVNAPGSYIAAFGDGKQDAFGHIHPDDRERVRAEYAEIVRTGEARRLEFRVPGRDGKVRQIQSEATPVRDASGKVAAVLRIGRDLTDERRDAAAVRLTLETLFEQAPIGIAIADTQGRYLKTNRNIRSILGYQEADVSSHSLWEAAHPADRPRAGALFRDLQAGRIERFSMEKRIVRGDGEMRWVDCYVALVHPPLGGSSFIIEVAQDITERKRVGEALREREELLEGIFDHAPIGISITDADARFVRVNRRFREMLGYSEDELYRLTGWDIIHEGDMEENTRLRNELWSGKRADFVWERRYVRKNGEVLWVQNTVSLIRDAEGRPRYSMALVEDISQRRLASAAIQATAEKLQALTRRLVELQETERRDIARELHDRVGQTLTAMRINMDMIRTRLAERDDARIRERNDDSLELIESAFRAVENVMYELRPPMIDEYGLVPALQWYARKFTDRTAIRVEVRGDEDWRCRPETELALFRIVQEALNNVARHARARNVAIELREDAQTIVLTIEDDGVGFEGGADRTQKAGYGLITMRERAEALGGIFEAHSEPGKGTRIAVRIPRRP